MAWPGYKLGFLNLCSYVISCLLCSLRCGNLLKCICSALCTVDCKGTPNQNLHSFKDLIVALELGCLKGGYINFGLVF